MNNQQFRRLVQEQSSSSPSGRGSATSPKHGSSTPALGSRQRSSIPMTPRTVGGSGGGVDFAKQLRQQQQQEPPAKKFKSSAAPKGSKLAAGYQDRSRALREQDEAQVDDKAKRVKALEEQLKLGQIEQQLFEKLRDEIVGGDIENVHLVKGLDRRLLERVKRGEDVLSGKKDEEPEVAAEEREEDVDAAFDEMESQDVQPLLKEEKSYATDMAPPPPPARKKRTRNDILREMKAARARAAEEKSVAEPALGSRFRKISAQQPNSSRIEKDEKGREVLIMVDEHGNVKRKVRKSKTRDGEGQAMSNGLLMPEKGAIPLGMAVPDAPAAPKPEEEEEGDIFADAGSDYDPLGGADEADESDSSDSSKNENESEEHPPSMPPARRPSASRSPCISRSSSPSSSGSSRTPARPASPPPSKPSTTAPRNYFGTASTESPSSSAAPPNPLQDATMLAALKRAAAISGGDSEPSGTSDSRQAEAAKKARHAAMLAGARADRDLDDMDLGFGSSRVGDEEGEDHGKLAEWKGFGAQEDDGNADGDGDGRKRSGLKQRKRGKKKRKGEGDSAKDVMAVLERRGK